MGDSAAKLLQGSLRAGSNLGPIKGKWEDHGADNVPFVLHGGRCVPKFLYHLGGCLKSSCESGVVVAVVELDVGTEIPKAVDHPDDVVLRLSWPGCRCVCVHWCLSRLRPRDHTNSNRSNRCGPSEILFPGRNDCRCLCVLWCWGLTPLAQGPQQLQHWMGTE